MNLITFMLQHLVSGLPSSLFIGGLVMFCRGFIDCWHFSNMVDSKPKMNFGPKLWSVRLWKLEMLPKTFENYKYGR